MKKFTAVLLTVLMIAGMFISCENNLPTAKDETVSVSFEKATARSLTASLEKFDPNNYYWAYKAEKKDTTGLISGKTDFAWVDEGKPGLSKTVAGFSQGAWEFTLYAYNKANNDESNLVYSGINSRVTLLKGGVNTVKVTVSPILTGEGTLFVDIANITLKPASSTLTEDQINQLTKHVKVTNLNSSDSFSDYEGGQYPLPAGEYKVTVSFGTYASGSVIANVYPNITTTVTGILDEILTDANFDTDANVIKKEVTSAPFNSEVQNDIIIEDAQDKTVKATVPNLVAKDILTKAIDDSKVDSTSTTNTMKLSLSVNTISTSVINGKTKVAYEIGLSSVLESKKNNTSEVKQYSSPVSSKLSNYVVAEIQLQKGLSAVSVTHKDTEMQPLESLDATPANEENGGFFYDTSTGLLTIMTKSFSPFEVTYVIPVTPYWGNGNGTEEDPYLIKNLADFKKLGSKEWQAKIEEGLNEDIYYRLDSNIDLSNEAPATCFIKTFGGIFDGNGHTIKGNNNIKYIFYYLLEDTTIKNLNIDFDTESITRIWSMTAIKGYKNGMGSDSDGDPLLLVAYDKEAINITLDNVNFVPQSNHSYYIGDNNSALYQDGTTSYGSFLDEGKYSNFFISQSVRCGEKVVKYTITIKNCKVEGNYNGGFGNSGGAIFFGGQPWGADLVLEDCSFNGNHEGYYVGLVLGNASGCQMSTITLENVVNNGTISSCTDKGSLLYANRTNSKEATVIGQIFGNEIKKMEPSLALSKPVQNQAFDFTKIEGEAELKLFLPSVYTYEGETFIYQTNSNTVTIPVTKTTNDIYLAKVVSTDDSIVDKMSLQDWSNVSTATIEGIKYQFVDYNNEKYMVLNYGVSYSKFYTKDDKGAEVEPALMKNAMLLQRGTSNEIKAVSTLITLK